jgi:hypothetical protein
MAEHDGEREDAVAAVLLWLSKDPRLLAWVLERMVPGSALTAALRSTGQPQAPGGAARNVARLLPRAPRLAPAVVRAVLEHLPTGAVQDTDDAAPLDPEEIRRRVRDALLAGDQAGAQAASELAERWGDQLAPLADPQPQPDLTPPSPPARRKPRATQPDAAAEVAKLRAELAAAEAERTRQIALQRQLAQDLDTARAEVRTERRRAADLKKRMAAAAEPGTREQGLEESAALARRELSVMTQKFKLVEEERDDLRACLEDHDRFQALEIEEIPSFRKRPLLAEEVELTRRLSADGRSFRILVVGGGEPQFRHRDKLAEYAELIGFSAEWRMAEYVSWHREMDKLGSDMKSRFDALVILHYNRTTFTRNARAICDEAGHKPCITCHYEGFTSLRAVLRECLRQLLERRGGK